MSHVNNESGKQHMKEGIELLNQEKSEHSEKWKPTNTCKYWKWTQSNKWRWKKKFKKSISGEREDYSKPNYIAEISSKR